MTEKKIYRSELTPLAFLRRSAFLYPFKTAVVYEKMRYTYREFEERVNRLSSSLLASGLRKRERVAFLSPNTPALLEAHFAVPAAGGVLVAINTRLSPDEIKYILHHSGASFLFVDKELYGLVEKIDLGPLRVVTVENSGEPADPYEQFMQKGSPETLGIQIEDEEESISINYTSGTTGRPKGVIYTHRGAYLNSIGEIIETGMNSDSVFCWTLPMFHCNGWCFPWSVTAMAGTHVCLRRVDPDAIYDAIRDHGVTHLCGAPIVMNMLLNSPRAATAKFARRVQFMTAASAPPAAILEGMERIGFDVTHAYGLTEVYGPATLCAWHPQWNERPDAERAALKARQGVKYQVQEDFLVCDPETLEPVAADGETVGELLYRGNVVMKGYLKNPEATRAAFEGGYFHTGDLGVTHPDGYIEIRDRSKDIIISGGENISSIEVEGVLYRHPAVLEAAVVAKPDDKWGETPCAFVTIKPGATTSEAELIEFCRDNMAHFKCPRTVVFTELPKTSTGKIQKFVLREKAASL